MNFKSLPQLLDHFKEEKTCIEYYEQIRWNGNPTCPHCGSLKPYKTNIGWKCSDKECHKKFTVKVGTIFENSKISFRIWFGAIYLATNHKKGISSVQLALDLGITQKTAWFVLHRIREMLKEKAPKMLGENNMVEIDEAYIGGKEANRHYYKQLDPNSNVTRRDGKPARKKNIVIGLIERDGHVVLKHVPAVSHKTINPLIEIHVHRSAEINTDENKVYQRLGKIYTHDTVIHSAYQYVKGTTSTNAIENFWSVLKRGLNGIYHQVSDKHLERYLDEYAGRFNTRKLTSQERFENFLYQSESYLSYKKLTEK